MVMTTKMEHKDRYTKEVTIEMSNFCPINCIHCSTWHSLYYDGNEEYEIDVEKVIDVAIKHINSTPDTPIRVRMSGGDPIPFLSREIFEKLRTNCLNIKEWIIATSGAMPIQLVKDLHSQLRSFNGDLLYRISLYGNKRQHTKIVRNEKAYDNTMETIKWLTENRGKVELTTPIFGLINTLNTAKVAHKFKIPVRLARLLPVDRRYRKDGWTWIDAETYSLVVQSQRKQLWIAKTVKLIYGRDVHLTCSLYGKCEDGSMCDYPKSTILATGEIIGCAIGKQSPIMEKIKM